MAKYILDSEHHNLSEQEKAEFLMTYRTPNLKSRIATNPKLASLSKTTGTSLLLAMTFWASGIGGMIGAEKWASAKYHEAVEQLGGEKKIYTDCLKKAEPADVYDCTQATVKPAWEERKKTKEPLVNASIAVGAFGFAALGVAFIAGFKEKKLARKLEREDYEQELETFLRKKGRTGLSVIKNDKF